jgi:hypothetical protein
MPKPEKPAKKRSELDDLVEQLEAGEILTVTVPDEKTLKGTRIGLARRAAGRQFKLEFRADLTKMELGVRRSGERYVPPAPAIRSEVGRARGRPRKAQ